MKSAFFVEDGPLRPIFSRRWPPRSFQWTLGHLTVVVVICALVLGLSRLSMATVIVLAFVTGLILGPLLMARRGFRLMDIATLMAVALLTVGFLLPEMVQTRIRTAGQRTFPIKVPTSVYSLLFDDR
jgi:hypothetical protein